jgi:hypothetical protein
MATSRKQALSWVLKELASHFERQGWRLSERPTSLLKMTQEPSPDVQHTLLMHEPFRPSDLPSPDVIGLACAVNVYFPELEALIDGALRRETPIKLSMRLALSQLVPAEHVFAGNVHLIRVGDDVQQAVHALESDFATYLEPERRRLCMSSVFEDDEYQPPKIDSWAWRLRRAAYYLRHMDAVSRQALFVELNQQAGTVLGVPAANDPAGPAVFFDMAAVQRSIALRGAQELRQFLVAVL